MQSKSFSFRQSFRKIFASSRDRSSVLIGDTAPVPSGSIGGPTVVVTTAIQTSLALLKEGSALATNVPFIGPIAGLLLLTLQMRGFKGDWEAVMQKLTSVANIVVNVGESCQTHNLKEEDLPAGLRTILLSIRTELDGIEAALKECAETGRVTRVILRADMLQTVKQYDAKLSNVLQTFQVSHGIEFIHLSLPFTCVLDS
ncbi:hypothetical protein B0F90DRAFT_441944 [Multifurca ochricompacta]|uniref:Uncharacterized protein n=1 Tax=Multifurca ochricompacta TaxID=376703 RepID=A0AAD4QJ19_9AGAM|nr:hypothetical protein B0F90DRAFT_441944 [Multifurca ochricompacta]